MVVKFNFNIEAWIKELQIEAESEQEALDKLNSMTLAEILEAGAIVDSTIEINDVEATVIENDLVVKIENIEYDFGTKERVADYLRARLPKEQTITLRGVTNKDDIEERLKDEILLATDYEVKSFDFEILETK